MAWCGWSDRLAPFVLAVYARAKPCCCWLYLACVPVLVYLVLSCMSAVVMHIVVVCLRINKVGYYYYYAAIFWINSILFSSRCGENRRNHDFDEKMNVISATRPSLAPVFTVFRYWGSQLLPPPPLQNFRFAPLRWNRGWLASIGRCGGEWFVGRQSVHMYYPFQSVSCAAFVVIRAVSPSFDIADRKWRGPLDLLSATYCIIYARWELRLWGVPLSAYCSCYVCLSVWRRIILKTMPRTGCGRFSISVAI